MKHVLAFLLLGVLACSGCATAVMSGAADGDYPTTMKDARIMRDVRTAIYRDPLLSDERIYISVEAGIVTLRGSVDNRMHVDRALDAAREVPGVRGVNVELGIKGTP